jgi:uncharacterized protein
MTGFSIELGALRAGASRLTLESGPEGLDLDPNVWSGSIVGTVVSERNGDRISVRGKVTASARLECVRCLEEFIAPVEVPLDVFAERHGTASRADEEMLELDDTMVFHDGRSLDLRRQAREALLLELPIAPHCREDCLGLCLQCGAVLNQGPCGCAGRETGK